MLRELYYQFLPYRSYFGPLLMVGGIAAAFWIPFRLYRGRTLSPRPSIFREALLLIFVLYLAGLAVATLTPNRSSRLVAAGRGGIELRPKLRTLTCPSGPSGSRSFCVQELKANAGLFFPLGLLLPLIFTRLRFAKGVLIALGLAAGIEVVQYLSSAWGSYRAADVNDVILNVFGACVGLAIGLVLRLLPRWFSSVLRSAN